MAFLPPRLKNTFARSGYCFKIESFERQSGALEGPALSSDRNAEIITDGENGLLASTTEEYICKIRLLLQNRKLRETIGRAGRARIESAYCRSEEHTSEL